MSGPALLQLTGVAKAFRTEVENLDILRGIDLSVEAGETVALTGPSGSGKSTLLGLMAGLDRPTSGRILYKGALLSEMSEDALAAWRRERVGFVFQNFWLVETLTALENVTLPLELLGWRAAAARERAEALLGELGLSARLRHFPRQLSGGEQQRVGLARAFAHEPEIIFADEPTGSLDRATAGAVIESLLRLNESRKTALVLATHDAALAARVKRSVSLDRGVIARDG